MRAISPSAQTENDSAVLSPTTAAQELFPSRDYGRLPIARAHSASSLDQKGRRTSKEASRPQGERSPQRRKSIIKVKRVVANSNPHAKQTRSRPLSAAPAHQASKKLNASRAKVNKVHTSRVFQIESDSVVPQKRKLKIA